MKKIKLFLLLSLLTLLFIAVGCKQGTIAGEAITVSGQKVYTAQEVLQLVSDLEVKKQGVLSQSCHQAFAVGNGGAFAQCAPKEFPLNGGGRCYGGKAGGNMMNLTIPVMGSSIQGWRIECTNPTTLVEAVVTCCK